VVSEEHELDYNEVGYVRLLQDMPHSHLELKSQAKGSLEVAEGLQLWLDEKSKDEKNVNLEMDMKRFVRDELRYKYTEGDVMLVGWLDIDLLDYKVPLPYDC